MLAAFKEKAKAGNGKAVFLDRANFGSRMIAPNACTSVHHQLGVVNWNVCLALGSNADGRFGSPEEALLRSLQKLSARGVEIKAMSSLYLTLPYGGGRQKWYCNAVVIAQSPLPAAGLLRVLKSIEREAGRRLGRRNGPRPLDLDILLFRGQRVSWGYQRRRMTVRKRRIGDLIVPHPEISARAFVLVPLLEVLPHWVHPATGQSGRQALARLRGWRRQIRLAGPPPGLAPLTAAKRGA